jgi:hypothetical protein
MRLPGDVVFSLGAVIMAWDFLRKLMRPAGSEPKAAMPAGARPLGQAGR